MQGEGSRRGVQCVAALLVALRLHHSGGWNWRRGGCAQGEPRTQPLRPAPEHRSLAGTRSLWGPVVGALRQHEVSGHKQWQTCMVPATGAGRAWSRASVSVTVAASHASGSRMSPGCGCSGPGVQVRRSGGQEVRRPQAPTQPADLPKGAKNPPPPLSACPLLRVGSSTHRVNAI